jgi:tetratricopeptide (TPR) repeat protein
MSKSHSLIYSLVVFLLACAGKETTAPPAEQLNEPEPSIVSLTGEKYYTPQWSEKTKSTLDSNLNVAQKNFEGDASEENYIWLGRRLAYLYLYDSAINVFTEGLAKYPASFRLLRHRGHRYITLRKFDLAENDLKKASELMKDVPIEIEPDGAPNKLNIPLSNTQFNVWYHLGLAYYLQQDFEKAAQAYEECLKVSNNDDLVTATADWLYMTYQRAEEPDKAKEVLSRIHDNMKIIENDSYFKRLKMYQGKLKPEGVLEVSSDTEDADLSLATQGYGVGNWYLVNGDSAKANDIFNRVINGKYFAAFGFIAAENELVRQQN